MTHAVSPAPSAGEESPRRRRRWLRVVAAALLAVVGIGAADAAVLYARLERVAFRTPPDRPGETYVLLGSDSRHFVQTASERARFGVVGGERADVVLIVHVPKAGRPHMLAVPRDLLVFADSGIPRRLNVTMLRVGPQGIADALCRSLGVAADHVAIIGFDGFRALIDSVGGIEAEVDAPTRDAFTGLDLPSAGRHRLAGDAALAYVRSRHAERLVDGVWTPDADGAGSRPDRAAEAMRALGSRARAAARNPVVAQRIAWTMSSSVRVDGEMQPTDLAALGRALVAIQRDPSSMGVLPATTTATRVPVAEIDPIAARHALRTVGVTSTAYAADRCSPTLLTAVRASHEPLPGENGQ